MENKNYLNDTSLKDIYEAKKHSHSVVSGDTNGFIGINISKYTSEKNQSNYIASGDTNGFIGTNVSRYTSEKNMIKSLKKSKSSIWKDLK